MASPHIVQSSQPAWIGSAMFRRLRALLRANESGLIVLAVLIGIGAGLLTAGLSRSAGLMHTLLYGHRALSTLDVLDSRWLALVPAAGGLCLGVTSRVLA